MNDSNFYHDYGDEPTQPLPTHDYNHGDYVCDSLPLLSESGCCMIGGIIFGLSVGIVIGVFGA